jgi:hypothetical protein
VFEIDWQNSGDISRFAFVLESEMVGICSRVCHKDCQVDEVGGGEINQRSA